MLFQVESLENIVIFELIRCKFKQSSLPGLLSKTAFYSRRYEAYYRRQYESKFHQERDAICENWTIPGNLTYLQNKIILWFRAFVLEIFKYGMELIELLKRYDFRVKFCIERICITQTGRINKPKTILTILKDSQFLVEFHSGTLFQNMVMKKDLVSVSKEVLDTIEENTDFNKAVKVKASIADLLKLYFMDMIYVANECVKDGITSNVCAALNSCISIINSQESLRKLLDFMDLETRQKVLISNKLFFMNNSYGLDGEMIQYLSLNLPREEWQEMLESSFNQFFRVVLYDWRCSGFAVTVFKEGLEAGAVNIDNIIFIFSLGHCMNLENDNEDEFAEEYDTLCWDDGFSAHENMGILKMVWLHTPNTLKNYMKEYILKSDDIRQINAESLLFIVDSYPVRDQGKIISKLMEDINSRGFGDYKVEDYKKLYNMYLSLITKSQGKIVVSKKIVKKFKSFCNK